MVPPLHSSILFFSHPPIPPSLMEHLDQAHRTGSDFTWCGTNFGYRDGRGFSVTCPEGATIRILRAEGEKLKKLTLEGNHRGFLREGDVIQLPGMIPLLFKDLSPSKFRGGHRYAEVMPEEILEAVRECSRKKDIAFPFGSKLVVCYEPRLGLSLGQLAHFSPEITIYPATGDGPISFRTDPLQMRQIHIWDGDIVQIGDEPPFAYKTPQDIPFDAVTASEFGRELSFCAPAEILNLLANAIAFAPRVCYLNENDPRSLKADSPFSDEGVVSVFLNKPDTSFLRISSDAFSRSIGSISLNLSGAKSVILKIGSDLPFRISPLDLLPLIEKAKKGPPPRPPLPPMVRFSLKVLGLELDKIESERDVKSAFRKAARKYHPDHNKDADAVDNFKGMLKAYGLICDYLNFEKTIF